MNKNDFELIARAVAKVYDPHADPEAVQAQEAIIDSLADMCAGTNYMFKRDLFIARAKGES